MRYLIGLQALPWAISTVLLRLVRSPRRTLEALKVKSGLGSPNPARLIESKLPKPPRSFVADFKLAAIPNSVLHLVTNCLPYTQAGYTIRTHNILTAQNQLGISAQAVTRYGYPITIGKINSGKLTKLAAFDNSVEVSYHHLIPTGFATKHELDIAVFQTTQLVKELKPAVLHPATDFINGEVAAAVSNLVGLPFVYEVRGFLEQSWLTKSTANQSNSAYYQEFLARETEVMQQAWAITTLSETMKQEMINRGISAAKIFITPNAVSESLLNNNLTSTAARAKLGLAELPTFGIATTLYSFENVTALIDVAIDLNSTGKPAQLLIVGDGPEMENLKQQAKLMPDRIKVVGRKPFNETIDYYQAMDVFCVPRLSSSVTQLVTPLKPLEAMALNRPVVATDLPALAEIVHHEQTGLLVAPNSTAALSEAIGRLLYDCDHRAQLAAAAKEWVATERTWSKVAARYQKVYQQLGER